MSERRWYRITISIPLSHQDLLVGQLALLGFGGFVQEDHALECFIAEKRWNVEVKQSFTQTLRRFKREFPTLRLRSSSQLIKQQNWNKKWEEQTGIVEATKRIIIKPSWKKLPAKDRGKLVLEIDPKMSFGTGHHETTRLCLTLLEKYVRPGVRVLDFGCGTGILGIAAAKLGAHSVVAIDNDDWSIPNAVENVIRNGVQKIVKVLHGSVSRVPSKAFDLIVANIDLPGVLKFLSSLTTKVRRKGVVILSGLLVSDLPTVLQRLHNTNLVPLELIDEGEWIAIALTKP